MKATPDNRSNRLQVSREEQQEIKRAYEFILHYVREVHHGVTRVDVLCLAHAEQPGIPVVTDDEEMRMAAKDYGIKTLKPMDLLKLMLNCGHISLDKVREIGSYWAYLKDRPIDYRKDYKRLFGEELPR